MGYVYFKDLTHVIVEVFKSKSSRQVGQKLRKEFLFESKGSLLVDFLHGFHGLFLVVVSVFVLVRPSNDWMRPTQILEGITKKGNAKECSDYCTIALISHTSKVMLKILQSRLQQSMTHECTDVQAAFRKGRGTRDQITNICWIMEKAREFQKNIYSVSLTMPKPLTVWITTNCGKFYKRWEYQTT